MTPGLLNHEVRFTQVASGARIAWARSGHFGGPVMIRTGHWLTHIEYDLRSPIWRPLIERLGRQLELVRYDERGCGLSAADKEPLSLQTSLEELSVVAAARGAPRFALPGISAGVAAAVAYAAKHPDRVSHLVLLRGAAIAQPRPAGARAGLRAPVPAGHRLRHRRCGAASADARRARLGRLGGPGAGNLQITAQLGLAEKTVRNRLSALYAKLGVEGRAMAVVKARELGL